MGEGARLADEVIARFADPERGGFFATASDSEALIARRKELEDAPIPSGSSSAAMGLLRLSQLTGEPRYERHAISALRLVHEIAPRHPVGFGHLLRALDWAVGAPREVALVGPGLEPLERVVRSRLRPRLVLAGGPRLAQRAAGAGFPLRRHLPAGAALPVGSTDVLGLRATPGDRGVDQRGQVARRVEVTVDAKPTGLASEHSNLRR